jgi:periodic tryptophan protein 2
VKLWNTSSGFAYVTFSDHKAPVSGVVFAPNGTAVFSSSYDGTVRAFGMCLLIHR